jgi:outer membrane protein assembly factor BamB
VSRDTKLPVSLSAESIAWTAELPGRGLSGPIVVGKRVFVTASSGYSQDRLHVLCFDAANGKPLWERQFWATGRTLSHPKMCNATPTPASDGKRVFAFFSSNDLVCLDLDGNLLWYRGLTHDYANASNSLGMASSPVVVGETLVVQVENDSESLAVGIDVETGANRWKLDRPILANWTSPTILRGKTRDDDLVLLQSGKGLSALRPYTGFEVWRYDEGASTIPSSTVSGGVVYASSKGVTALQPDAEGAAPKTVWQSNRLSPGTASPVVLDGKVYALNSGGVLTCADAHTAENQWQLRVQVPQGEKTSRGAFSGTPLAANGHLYFFNEDGVAIVVKAGDKGEIVSSHDFKETILCTPAAADGALFIRSDKHLWKIAGP